MDKKYTTKNETRANTRTPVPSVMCPKRISERGIIFICYAPEMVFRTPKSSNNLNVFSGILVTLKVTSARASIILATSGPI